MRRVKLRLLFVFVAFGIGASLTWLYRVPIFLFLYVPAGGSLSPFAGFPILTSPIEAFGVTISLAIKGGLVVALPVATFSVATLVSPLLDRKQRRFLFWFFTPALFACFVLGAAFAYYVMLPTGMRYLLNFGNGLAVPAIRLSEYMGLVMALTFWAGVIFELPPAMFLLSKFGLVSYKRFQKVHRYVPVAAFFLGALITPTVDLVNSTLVAVPIILLFEVGLFLSWMAEGGHRTMMRKAKSLTARVLRRPNALMVRTWRRLKALTVRLWRWAKSVT